MKMKMFFAVVESLLLLLMSYLGYMRYGRARRQG